MVDTRINVAKIIAHYGGGSRYVTFIYLIYQVWHSPVAVGAALGVPSVAQWVLGPLAGLLADRFHRPRLITLMYASQCATLLGLLGVTYSGYAATLFGTIITYSLFFIVNGTDILISPSLNTLMTELVEPNNLVRWQAWLNSWGQGAWLVGLVMTGFGIEHVGATAALVVILLTCVAALFASATIPETAHRLMARRAELQNQKQLHRMGFRQAWVAIRKDNFLWAFMWIVAISNVPHNLLLSLPFFLSADVHAGYAGFSVVEASLAVGMMLANLWFIRRRQTYHHINRLLSAAFIIQSLTAVCLVVAATNHSIVLMTLSMAVYGATDSLFGPGYSLLSVTAPVAVRGQVLGVFNAVAVMMNPLMTIVTGWLVSLTTTPVILLALVVVFATASVIVLRLPPLRRQI